MSAEDSRYDIKTDEVMFSVNERIDVLTVAAAHSPWWNRALCAVNDAWVRLGVFDGDFHWHRHQHEDEFFRVLEGHLDIDIEDRTISLDRHQAYTVPAGVMHCPRARGRTTVLMIERAGVVPTGD